MPDLHHIVGDAIMRPFLQDVLQFVPLLRTLALAAVQDPLTPFKIVPHVGLIAMGDFLFHFTNMAIFTVLANTIAPIMHNDLRVSPELKFRLRRLSEQWKFGSGMDYYDH
jgi:lycopene cyclase CruP